MTAFSVTMVPSGETIQRNMKKLAEKNRKAFKDAGRVEADDIMAVSQEEVPVDKGKLKKSKRITQGVVNGIPTFTLEYRWPYAFFVHQIAKNYKNGKKSKYLSDPLFAAQRGMANRMAARMKRQVG